MCKDLVALLVLVFFHFRRLHESPAFQLTPDDVVDGLFRQTLCPLLVRVPEGTILGVEEALGPLEEVTGGLHHHLDCRRGVRKARESHFGGGYFLQLGVRTPDTLLDFRLFFEKLTLLGKLESEVEASRLFDRRPSANFPAARVTFCFHITGLCVSSSKRAAGWTG